MRVILTEEIKEAADRLGLTPEEFVTMVFLGLI